MEITQVAATGTSANNKQTIFGTRKFITSTKSPAEAGPNQKMQSG